MLIRDVFNKLNELNTLATDMVTVKDEGLRQEYLALKQWFRIHDISLIPGNVGFMIPTSVERRLYHDSKARARGACDQHPPDQGTLSPSQGHWSGRSRQPEELYEFSDVSHRGEVAVSIT